MLEEALSHLGSQVDEVVVLKKNPDGSMILDIRIGTKWRTVSFRIIRGTRHRLSVEGGNRAQEEY